MSEKNNYTESLTPGGNGTNTRLDFVIEESDGDTTTMKIDCYGRLDTTCFGSFTINNVSQKDLRDMAEALHRLANLFV